MGIENLPKYLMLSKLFWTIIRPFVVAVAKNTRNTTIDDDLVAAMDEILNANAVEFENEIQEKAKVRNAFPS